MSVIKVCVLLFGDKDQWSDYRDFKTDLQRRVKGHINIDDVLDIAGVHGNDQSQKHREYMKQRDAVIIVCSKPLKECIEQRKDLEFIVKGRSIKLDGTILQECLTDDNIRQKTILVSLDDDGSGAIPKCLDDRPHFNVDDEDVCDSVMNCIIADR